MDWWPRVEAMVHPNCASGLFWGHFVRAPAAPAEGVRPRGVRRRGGPAEGSRGGGGPAEEGPGEGGSGGTNEQTKPPHTDLKEMA